MLTKVRKSVAGALAVSGLLFGASLAAPPSHAEQAVIMVPEDDRDLPEGSQIPQVRVEETEEKVRDYKEKMRQTAPAQRRKQLPKDGSPSLRPGSRGRREGCPGALARYQSRGRAVAIFR